MNSQKKENCSIQNIEGNVYYVGMHNPGMRTFDIIMYTGFGTTYNSYLIMEEKNVLIETVHNTYTNEYIQKIEELVPISELDYVILNHTEPDHSGSLAALLDINPNIEVIGTASAIKNLTNIMNRTFQNRVVKSGDFLEIGDNKKLEFVVAPNLHWPDSMFTYFPAEKILFSCDVFGSHYCEQFLFDDQLKRPDRYAKERKNYYDCIFAPFQRFVLAGMEKIKEFEISYVCCSHGPVLRGGIKETMDLYEAWSLESYKSDEIAVFYVSAYGYTRRLAQVIERYYQSNNQKVRMFDLQEANMEEAVQCMHRAKAVFFGSPTINGDALEPLWSLINQSVINLAKGKPAFVFGSYGWSGEACQFLSDRLRALKYDVYAEGLRVQFNPSKEDEQKLTELLESFSGQF